MTRRCVETEGRSTADLCAAMLRPTGPACFLSTSEVELLLTRTYVARPGVDADGHAATLYFNELLIDRTRRFLPLPRALASR